jgi:dihydrofolate synthase/folylpolyglutamate synthase
LNDARGRRDRYRPGPGHALPVQEFMSQSISRDLAKLPQARFQSLHDWLRWQEDLHYPAIALGLDRCRAVAQRLALLPAPFRVLTVGGTNGKGSSATMLDLILRRAGGRVGRYTSPHLCRYNERICIDGTAATDADLCGVFDEIDRARDGITLTFFEFGTLAALMLFREAQVDAAVMEVGLGGRLDAVNILDADAALIATVDLDHENWLGGDRESIGMEKAGIFRRGRPAICADPRPPASVEAHARAIGASLFQAGRDFRFTARESTWDWHGPVRSLRDLPIPAGQHGCQLRNASGVLMVLEALAGGMGIPEAAIREGLREFAIPARFQILPGHVPVILDVAHNPQSARALADSLARLPDAAATRIVLGMLRDKDHAAFVRTLAPAADAWYAATLGGDRGFSAGDLARVVQSCTDAPCTTFADVPAALARNWRRHRATGSS